MSANTVTTRQRWLGAIFVLAGILFQALWLGFPAMFVSIGLVVTYWIWITTPWQVRPGLRLPLAIGILVMVLHVAEEYAGGLQSALPALFDQPGWAANQYLTFNVAWGLVFLTAFATLHPKRALPSFVVLFFAIVAGVANGVVHTGVALLQGGYFPGLWTAPLCFAAGVWILRSLYGRPGDTGGVSRPQVQ
jgi:hypothetical protein